MTPLNPVDAIGRLVLALLLGSLVGLERERGDRAAGLRTHALVCLGSALFMLVSAYGASNFPHNPNIRFDPTRVAAQVVSGIGFLGAGTIIFRREIVRGLTTAAGLWVVAGIGLAAGIGMYLPAVTTTVASLIILAVFRPLEDRLFRRPERLLLHVRPEEGQLAAIREAFQRSGTSLRRLVLYADEVQGQESVSLEYYPSSVANIERLVETLRGIPGFVTIEHVSLIPSDNGNDYQDQDESDERDPDPRRPL